MKNYTQAEKEFVLRPIVWLVFHAIILIFWIIIGIIAAYFLGLFIVSPILLVSVAIILATGAIALLLKILNIYFGDNFSKNDHAIEINGKPTKLSKLNAKG